MHLKGDIIREKQYLGTALENINWEQHQYSSGTMIVVRMGQDKEAAASEQKTTTVEENGNSATDNKVSETQTTDN